MLEENNITGRDFAKHLGLSETQTYKKLSGKAEFKASEICHVANLLNIDPAIFFTPTVDNLSTKHEKR